MILHVTFSDGSNPWVCYADRKTIAKDWRRWMKYHPDTAQPTVWISTKKQYVCSGNDTYLLIDNIHGNTKEYRHLGHALAALERLGGENV